MSFIATKEVFDTAHGRVTPPSAHRHETLQEGTGIPSPRAGLLPLRPDSQGRSGLTSSSTGEWRHDPFTH